MKLKQRLSDTIVRKLKVPAKDGDKHAQQIYWDKNLLGFGVCVSSSGQKSYVVQRGSMTRRTIERCELISFDDAYNTALEWLRLMGQGIDPKHQERIKQTGNLSLKEVLDHYLEHKKSLGERTIENYRSAFNKHLGDWQDKPLASLSTDLLLTKHKAIYEAVATSKKGGRYVTGESVADGTIRLLGRLWNYAGDSDLIPNLPDRNPVRALSRTKSWYVGKPRRRTSYVHDSDLPTFWQALNGPPDDDAAPCLRTAIKVFLLTGLRAGTVKRLRWEHVDLQERVLRLPAGLLKGARHLDLPLSNELHAILETWLAEGKDTAGWVFPSVVAGKHIADLRAIFLWLAQQTGQDRYSPHDLRRTFATACHRSGLTEFDVRALLHHTLGDSVTAGYIQSDVEQLRQPMQRVTDRLMRLCTPNVIDLARRRKTKA